MLVLAAPSPGVAQEREVVSKEIAVARDEAGLRLEMADGEVLDVRLRGGEVRVNDRVAGHYVAGGALESAWRELLGQAVSLDDGPLARALVAWTPSPMAGDEGALAAELDRTLEDALRARPSASPGPGAAPAATAAGAPSALRELLRRPDRLLELARALEGLDLDDVRVHLGENVLVEAGNTVESTLIVVDGTLTVSGEVHGSVVLLGGALDLEPGGLVTGEVRLADDARIHRNGGRVDEGVRTVRARDGDDGSEETLESVRDEIRRELRRELRGESRDEAWYGDRGSWDGGPLRWVAHGIGGLVGNLVMVLVVGLLLGGAAVHFAPTQLDVVGRTIRTAPMRAAAVGIAGAFVALPAWVLGFVALAISIVGILAIPFWAVLFPLAVVVAVALGFVAAAQIVGEWVAEQRYDRLTWVRAGNPYSTVLAGVGALMIGFVLANVLAIAGPWTGVFRGILMFFGFAVTILAALMGFGAVLLTRGGRRAEYPDGGGGLGDWGLDFGPMSPRRPPPSSPPYGAGEDIGATGTGTRAGPSGADAPGTGAPGSGTARGTGERVEDDPSRSGGGDEAP